MPPGVSRVVIDLAGVTTLTSAGVRALHRLHRECRLAGRRLVSVGTANPAVHRYLYLSGLLPLVDARPTIPAALRVHPSFPAPRVSHPQVMWASAVIGTLGA